MIVSAVGPNVKSCLSHARVTAGLKLSASREKIRSGGEDGLYRVELADGTIVECTIISRSRADSFIVSM